MEKFDTLFTLKYTPYSYSPKFFTMARIPAKKTKSKAFRYHAIQRTTGAALYTANKQSTSTIKSGTAQPKASGGYHQQTATTMLSQYTKQIANYTANAISIALDNQIIYTLDVAVDLSTSTQRYSPPPKGGYKTKFANNSLVVHLKNTTIVKDVTQESVALLVKAINIEAKEKISANIVDFGYILIFSFYIMFYKLIIS